jgi:hypothetical protein
MKIDWTALREGYEETLEKTAVAYSPPAAPSSPAPPAGGGGAKPMNPPARNPKPGFGTTFWETATSPFKAVADGVSNFVGKFNPVTPITHAISDAGDALKSVAPLGLAAVAGGGLLGGGSSGGGGAGNNYGSGGGSRGDILNYNKAGVSTMNAPKVKVGGFLLDPLMAAAERRAANSVLNEVTKTNPFGESEASADAHTQPHMHEKSDKEIQLVSKYPELAKLLEDEKNKAYLAQLTS